MIQGGKIQRGLRHNFMGEHYLEMITDTNYVRESEIIM